MGKYININTLTLEVTLFKNLILKKAPLVLFTAYYCYLKIASLLYNTFPWPYKATELMPNSRVSKKIQWQENKNRGKAFHNHNFITGLDTAQGECYSPTTEVDITPGSHVRQCKL
jgi:hypothetical protein